MQLVSSTSLYSVGLYPSACQGGAISKDGLFVTEALVNTPSLQQVLVGLGPGGQVEREISIPDSQQIGSTVGVDPVTGTIYAAYAGEVFKVAPDFSSVTVLPFSFGEDGGVAISSNGTVYVVDSSLGRIDVLNSTQTAIASTIAAGTDPLGISFGPGGTLYYTDGSYYGTNVCQIVGVNLSTGLQTVVESGLPELDSLDAAPDGSFYAATHGGDFLHLIGPTIQDVPQGDSVAGIAIDVAVPEPTTASLVISVGLLLCQRSCRHRSRKTNRDGQNQKGRGGISTEA